MDEYLPYISKLWFIGGHIQSPTNNLSNFYKREGRKCQCSGVQGSLCIVVILISSPIWLTYYSVISKYLRVGSFPGQTSRANIKFESAAVDKTDRVGSGFLMTLIYELIVSRFRVLMIILAKPTKVVIIIAIEIIPPVKVLYSSYS